MEEEEKRWRRRKRRELIGRGGGRGGREGGTDQVYDDLLTIMGDLFIKMPPHPLLLVSKGLIQHDKRSGMDSSDDGSCDDVWVRATYMVYTLVQLWLGLVPDVGSLRPEQGNGTTGLPVNM